MQVPLLDHKGQYASFREELSVEIKKLFNSQQVILGLAVESLEREIAPYWGRSIWVGVASGSDALLLSFMAADAGPGDEVYCP